MKTTKKQRAAWRDLATNEVRGAASCEQFIDDARPALLALLDDLDEAERAGEALATTITCGAPASAPCALAPGMRCDHHTIGALIEERRKLRLDLAAQQSEARALRAQQHIDAGRERVPFVTEIHGITPLWPSANLQGFDVAEWAERNRREIADALAKAMPVEFARAAVGLPCDEPDMLAALPEYQLAPVDREAPARVLAVLTRR